MAPVGDGARGAGVGGWVGGFGCLPTVETRVRGLYGVVCFLFVCFGPLLFE
jgi:hypothetical protein